MEKPFSQACENNKDPILQIIRNVFTKPTKVWEIGSGTGQHACYFAQNLPHLLWQPTDRQENLTGINTWVAETDATNLMNGLPLDVMDGEWPCRQIEAVFTANTLHIMHWEEVKAFFNGLGRYATEQVAICIYGPFNYQGSYTSASNERFDQWLKARDPNSGIRDFEAISELAEKIGLHISNDHAMPANNRLLVMQRT